MRFNAATTILIASLLMILPGCSPGIDEVGDAWTHFDAGIDVRQKDAVSADQGSAFSARYQCAFEYNLLEILEACKIHETIDCPGTGVMVRFSRCSDGGFKSTEYLGLLRIPESGTPEVVWTTTLQDDMTFASCESGRLLSYVWWYREPSVTLHEITDSGISLLSSTIIENYLGHAGVAPGSPLTGAFISEDQIFLIDASDSDDQRVRTFDYQVSQIGWSATLDTNRGLLFVAENLSPDYFNSPMEIRFRIIDPVNSSGSNLIVLGEASRTELGNCDGRVGIAFGGGTKPLLSVGNLLCEVDTSVPSNPTFGKCISPFGNETYGFDIRHWNADIVSLAGPGWFGCGGGSSVICPMDLSGTENPCSYIDCGLVISDANGHYVTIGWNSESSLVSVTRN